MKSKKGMILWYWVLGAFVLGLAIFFAMSALNKLEGEPNFVGELSLEYLKAVKETEIKLAFIEDAAKKGIFQTILDLGESGGYSSEPECGNFNDYVLWQSLDMSSGKKAIKNCFPNHKSLKGNFNIYLSRYMDDFFDGYCQNTAECPFVKDNYDFLLEESLVVSGFAVKPLITSIYYSPHKKKYPDLALPKRGEYRVLPNFVQKVDYDIDDYELIKAQAITINAICANAVDLRDCVVKEAGKIGRWNVDIEAKDTERTFAFSVTSDKEFPYYNKDDKKIEKKKVEVKFAMYIEDLPPPPIEGLSVSDNIKGEHSVMLRWKKSSAEDVDKYMIYFAKKDFVKDFAKLKIGDMKEDSRIKTKEILYDKTNTFDSIDLSSCELKQVQGKIKCMFGDKSLNLNELYYLEGTDELIYILYDSSLEEDKDYYFAVTAVDKGNNEINNIDSDQKLSIGKNAAEAKSEDDLGPGLVTDFSINLDSSKNNLVFKWNKVNKNLVADYALDDLKRYHLYYKGCNEPTDFPLDRKEILAAENPELTASKLQFPSCDSSTDTDDYHFFILARDAEDNPKESFNKLEELGLVIKRFGVPS